MNASTARTSSSLSRVLVGASLLIGGALVAACSSADGEGTGTQTEQSLAQACASKAYQAGASYAAGDRVTVAGKAYECKPYPYSGWCSIGGAYAPGSGSNWQDAWSEVGSCTGGGAPPAAGGSCNATAWQAGKQYKTGDVVTFKGGYYVAEHENPGYDPTISTWFWDPKTGCTGGGTPAPAPAPAPAPGGNTCGATAWQSGKAYKTGDIVTYGGSYYIAEHENPGYDPIISTWFWDPYTCNGSTPAPAPAPSPAPPSGGGGSGFEKVISRAVFESMFPSRNGFYTYDGLVQATKTYPAFASTGTADDQKREVAAFLANVNHETGALVYVEEINKSDYCDNGAGGCPCAPGKRYFGRGPIQLSWNYNYCAASQSIFGDKEVLRTDPDRVAREAWVAWATGLFYWMTSTGAGSMTCHNAMVNGSQFGETIRTINGGLECNGRNPGQVQSRIDAYVKFCNMLGVAPGGKTTC
jgi:chitodextrinase/predicted chitinase